MAITFRCISSGRRLLDSALSMPSFRRETFVPKSLGHHVFERSRLDVGPLDVKLLDTRLLDAIRLDVRHLDARLSHPRDLDTRSLDAVIRSSDVRMQPFGHQMIGRMPLGLPDVCIGVTWSITLKGQKI